MATRILSINQWPAGGEARCVRRGRRAFTLAESLIASVVLAAGVVAVSGTLTASYQQSAALSQTATALSLAQQLMEEIAAKSYLDPNTGTGTSNDREAQRSLYDNVYDYNGYADSSSALSTLGGTSISIGNGEVFRRSVTVEYRNSPSGSSVTSGNYALITVVVTPPSAPLVKLYRMVCNTTITH